MRASKLQKIKIIILSIIAFLEWALKVRYWSIIGKCSRAKIDKLNRYSSKKLLKIVKATYIVHNPHNIKLEHNKNYVLISNHLSHFDIPLIFMTLDGSIRMIAKKELFRIPIWGPAMIPAEHISIDRENREQAMKDMLNAREKIDSGIIPWIAPEGTRSRTGHLGKFKKGGFLLAIQTNAIIIPITIVGSNKILPAKTTNFGIGEHVDIYISDPIDTTKYNIKEIDLLMEDVKKSIEKNITN